MKREIPPTPQIAASGPDRSSQTRWQLERIVAELRNSREETHSIRRDGEDLDVLRKSEHEVLENGLQATEQRIGSVDVCGQARRELPQRIDDPGRHFDPIAWHGRTQVVDLDAQSCHAAPQTRARVYAQAQRRRMRPRGLIQPPEVDRVVHMSVGVNVGVLHVNRNHMRRGQVPSLCHGASL